MTRVPPTWPAAAAAVLQADDVLRGAVDEQNTEREREFRGRDLRFGQHLLQRRVQRVVERLPSKNSFQEKQNCNYSHKDYRYQNQKCFISSVDQEILTKAKRPLALRPPIVNKG